LVVVVMSYLQRHDTTAGADVKDSIRVARKYPLDLNAGRAILRVGGLTMKQDTVLRLGQEAAVRRDQVEGALLRGDVTVAIMNAELLAHEAHKLLRGATVRQLLRASKSKLTWGGIPGDDRKLILEAAAAVRLRRRAAWGQKRHDDWTPRPDPTDPA
jgi:hypothetical protein